MNKEQIVARARTIGQQRQMVEREMERLMMSLVDLSNSLRTIKNMGDEEMLVPVGGGAMVKTKLVDKNVFIPVGAGYALEYGVEDAKTEVDKRIKMTEKAVHTLRAELKKLDDEFHKLEQDYSESLEGGK